MESKKQDKGMGGLFFSAIAASSNKAHAPEFATRRMNRHFESFLSVANLVMRRPLGLVT